MKNKRLKIGIAGCGAIGSSLALFIRNDFKDKAVLAGIYDKDPKAGQRLRLRLGRQAKVCRSLGGLIRASDLVIEATSMLAAFDIAYKSVCAGRDVMVMSSGGIMSGLGRLRDKAGATAARIYVPSGAVAGIDALKAALCARVAKVTLTTKKHPRSFLGVRYLRKKGLDAQKIRQDTLLFEGPAQEAIKLFPQNINVAATLSMAGLGPAKTRVKIVASPRLKRNTHEVRIEGVCGKVSAVTENELHPDNPKTSFLAVLSAMAVLKQIVEPLKIGT